MLQDIKEHPLWEPADVCLRTSLYATGVILINKTAKDCIPFLDSTFRAMLLECRVWNWFGHRKSHEYTWEKDVHNGKKTIRHYIGKFICKYFGKTLHCGLNLDQYRALFTTLYLLRDFKPARQIARRILFGYICRLGFSPSLTEWAVIKPQSFILLFRMFWYLYPLYLLVWPFWRFSMWRNLREPIEKSTTNKISLLPTMKLLGYKLPDAVFIKNTYFKYFPTGEDGKMIREAMIEGLAGGTNGRTGK